MRVNVNVTLPQKQVDLVKEIARRLEVSFSDALEMFLDMRIRQTYKAMKGKVDENNPSNDSSEHNRIW